MEHVLTERPLQVTRKSRRRQRLQAVIRLVRRRVALALTRGPAAVLIAGFSRPSLPVERAQTEQIKAAGQRVAAVHELVAAGAYADALDAIAAVQDSLTGELRGVQVLRGLAAGLEDAVR